MWRPETHSLLRLTLSEARGEETRGLDSGGGGSDLEKGRSKAPAPWQPSSPRVVPANHIVALSAIAVGIIKLNGSCPSCIYRNASRSPHARMVMQTHFTSPAVCLNELSHGVHAEREYGYSWQRCSLIPGRFLFRPGEGRTALHILREALTVDAAQHGHHRLHYRRNDNSSSYTMLQDVSTRTKLAQRYNYSVQRRVYCTVAACWYTSLLMPRTNNVGKLNNHERRQQEESGV